MTKEDSGGRGAEEAAKGEPSAPAQRPIERRLNRVDASDGTDPEVHERAILGLQGPLVIVGDPGAGKTVLMESFRGSKDVTVVGAARLVRMTNPAKMLGPVTRLVIDGLDEVASNAAGGGVDAVLMKLSELDYPDFILSCRAADWRGAADRIKIKDDFGRDATILALKPFDRDDASRFLQTRFASLDADTILDHLSQRALHDIYGNPLTLRLLAEVALDGGALPESRGALLARACPKLVLEDNDRHKGSAHAGRDPDALMLAAGAGSAAFLLCDKLGIFNGATADLPSAFFPLASLAALPSGSEMGHAIKTRLFKGEGENLLVPVHRVVAEYLGAKWLASCVSSGQSARRVIALLRRGGSVPTSLRALNAWLAGFSPELAARCVSDDPYGVLRYGDVAGLPLPTARALLRALADLSREDPFFRAEDWSRQSASGLARVELKEELLDLIKAPGEHQLLGGLLIDALHGTTLGAALTAELHAILLDPARNHAQRASALDTLVEQGAISDWPMTLKSLAALGDQNSLRIAATSSIGIAVADVAPEQAVPLLLAHIQMTFSPIGIWKAARSRNTIHADRRLLRQPASVLDAWLDMIAAYGLMVRRQDRRRMSLVDFALALLVRRLGLVPAPSPADLGRWLDWLRGQTGYDNKAPEKIRAYFADNPAARRAVQIEMLLNVSEKDLMKLAFRIGDSTLGLYPNEEDCAHLLRAWYDIEEEAGPDTEKWETLVWMGRTRDGLSTTMRQAAEETTRGDPARSGIIERFAEPIVEQRDPEDERWQAEREAEREQAFASHRSWIETNLGDVDAGGAVLEDAARAYRGDFSDVSDLPGEPSEKMAAFLTPSLAQRALSGFIASLSRSDMPSALRIAECHARNQRYPIEVVMIAGVTEMFRLGRSLATIPRANLKSAFMAWRRDPASNTEDPLGIEEALAAIVLDTPAAQEEFYRTSIEPQLAADVEHVSDLYLLTHERELAPIAARLSREWLGGFPMVRATTVGDLVTPLLGNDPADIRATAIAARDHVCADLDAVFFWLGVDFLTDFAACERHLREAAADRPGFLWTLRLVTQPPVGLRLSDLSPDQLTFVIDAFASHWPFARRPDEVTRGDTNAWDAADFIKEAIAALSAIPTSAAAAKLASLLTSIDSGYLEDLKHAAVQQRRVQADHDYVPADLATLKAAVTGALPHSVDDLRAFFEDRLTAFKAKLAGNNLDSWVVFWDRDRPHEENFCRNRLVDQLSSELPAAITFHPEEQMPGVTRADIGLSLDTMVLPIEIKGQWHAQVWAAASEQLDAQYTRDWRADRSGVYIVLWFGDVPGFNLPPHPDGANAPATPDQLRTMLVERIPVDRRPSIDVYVLDVSGTPEGRQRLSVGRQRKRRAPAKPTKRTSTKP